LVVFISSGLNEEHVYPGHVGIIIHILSALFNWSFPILQQNKITYGNELAGSKFDGVSHIG